MPNQPGAMTWPQAVAACGTAVQATGQSWEVVPKPNGMWAVQFVGPFAGYDPATWGKS